MLDHICPGWTATNTGNLARSETNGITNVTTTIKFASQADRDAAMSTGMTDGMEMSYKQLDGVLAG